MMTTKNNANNAVTGGMTVCNRVDREELVGDEVTPSELCKASVETPMGVLEGTVGETHAELVNDSIESNPLEVIFFC